MRKNLEKEEIEGVLMSNYIGHLAFISQARPYMMPITYYYNKVQNAIISYSGEGLKLSAMRKNNAVSLEVDEINSVGNWKSVLAHGTFEEVQGIDAKQQLHQFAEGVKTIITKKEGHRPQSLKEFSARISSDKIPVVFRIKILEITGKQRES
ncbi:pyridoxamine 5'-phosphate oxidase family protein [Maribacter arcticus]|uniref:Flavin mononucleotide-binding protein n=1 Tax=Maribacter arcticus TaxID=561365 RepID=A0A1T5CHH9_9FLAO|nr:pyridoxamine 5'-phosphate oxidase family protein [Maribacter arcticus]SKB58771.1 hypothetical protein SAMN05660866_02294 [Maribacter arcticus]